MSVLSDIKNVFKKTSNQARDVFGDVSDSTRKILSGVFGKDDPTGSSFIQRGAQAVQTKGQNLSPNTQRLLNSIQGGAPEKKSFLTALDEIPDLSPESKRILTQIKAYEPKSTAGKVGELAVKPLEPLKDIFDLAVSPLKGVAEGATKIRESGESFLAKTEQAAMAPTLNDAGGLEGAIDAVTRFGIRGGGGIIGTSMQMLGSGLEAYNEGKKVQPIVEIGLGLGGLTPAGAIFNALFNQPAVAPIAQAVSNKMTEYSTRAKGFIGLDEQKHPEIAYTIDTAFQFLPYILAGGAVKKAGGKITKVSIFDKMKDPKQMEGTTSFVNRTLKEVEKSGDASRLEKVMDPEVVKEVKEALGVKDEPRVKQVKTTEKAPKTKPVDTKAVPKSVQDLPTTKEAKDFILKRGEELAKTEPVKEIAEKVSFDQMKVEASELNMDLKAYQEFANSSKQIRAVVVGGLDTIRTKAETLRVKVQDLASKADTLTPELREQALNEINLLKAEYDAYYVAMRGTLAEVGRGLVSTKALKGVEKQMSIMEDLAGRSLDLGDIRDMAEGFAKGKSSGDVFGVGKPHLLDKVAEARTAWLVSNPWTHFANIASSVTRYLSRTPEKLVAAAIDIPASILKGRPREVFFKELLYEVDGLTRGTLKGLRDAIDVLRGKTINGEIGKFQNAIGGKTGKVVRSSLTALQAEDAIFRGINTQAELGIQALRTAKAEGLSGKALSLRIEELRKNPTAAMTEVIKKNVDKGVFQEKMGEIASILNQFRKAKNPWTRFAGKTVLPFIATPANTMKQAFIERSPLGIFSVRGLKGAARSEALAKIAVGTGVLAWGIDYTLSGGVTGSGPKNTNERNLLYSMGWQPYSLKIGDRWFSYKRLWPLNILLGVPATMVERYAEVEDEELFKQIATLSQAFATVTLDQTFLTGLSDLVAWSSGDYRASEFLSSTGQSLLPWSGALRFLRETNDKYLREAGGILEHMKNIIPGLSDDLIPKRDYWGNKIEKASTVPIFGSVEDEKLSPVEQEFIDLQYFPGVPLGQYKEWDFTDSQLDQIFFYVGALKQQTLPELVASEEYQSADKTDRRKMLEKANDAAHQYIYETYGPQLIYQQLKIKTATPEEVFDLYMYIRKEIYGFDDFPQEKKEEILLDTIDLNY